MTRQPGQAVCATVLAAIMVSLTCGSAEAQNFGPESGSTTGDPSRFDPGFPDSGDMPDFNLDDGAMNDSWQPGQGGGGPGFGPGQQPPVEFIEMILAVYGVLIGVAFLFALAVQAVICWLLYVPLAAIPEDNREMAPGHVWFMMIPCFNIIWSFFVSQRIAQSFQNYFGETGRTEFGDCGAQIGLWWSICLASCWVPCLGSIAAIAHLVLLIIYLVKIWGLKAEIAPATSFGTA